MKVGNYFAIMLTMMVFLYFLGITPSGSENIISDTGIEINQSTGELISGDIAESNWYNEIFNGTTGILFTIGLAGAVIVGFFTKTFDWKLALLPFFTSFVGKFVSFGWSIVTLAKDTGESWLIAIFATIFLPITVLFIWSVVKWFGGGE